MTEASCNAGKTRGKPFAKGNTAGRGRPAGSRNAATLLLDAIGSEAAQDVLRAAVEAARGGDVQAMKIILDRVWPPRRGRLLSLRLPVVETAADVSAALGELVQQVAAGELTVEEAGPVAAILEGKRKAIETAELEARIRNLEKSQ